MSIVTEQWNSFTLRVPLEAGPQQLYDAWATQEGLERWFLRKAEFTKTDGSKRSRKEYVQAGDVYEWLWLGYSDDVVERRPVLVANGKDTMQFLFSGDCKVTITVGQERGKTLLTLKQENIPLDQDPKMNLCLNCSTGWTFYLTNLKSVLEGGLDLRNRDELLPQVITA